MRKRLVCVTESEFKVFIQWYKKLMNYRVLKIKDRVESYFIKDKVDKSNVAYVSTRACNRKLDNGDCGKPEYNIDYYWHKLWIDCESEFK